LCFDQREEKEGGREIEGDTRPYQKERKREREKERLREEGRKRAREKP